MRVLPPFLPSFLSPSISPCCSFILLPFYPSYFPPFHFASPLPFSYNLPISHPFNLLFPSLSTSTLSSSPVFPSFLCYPFSIPLFLLFLHFSLLAHLHTSSHPGKPVLILFSMFFSSISLQIGLCQAWQLASFKTCLNTTSN